MSETNQKVEFFTATRAQFNALAEKNNNAIYFVMEADETTITIYKGNVPCSFPVKLVENFPETGERGFIYIDAAGTQKIWNGTSFISLNGADNYLSNPARHTVTAEEAGNGVFADIAEGDVGILFTMANGDKFYVSLNDLVDTYEANNAGKAAIKITVSDYKISADLNISAEEGNQLEVKQDGVYVKPLCWQEVTSA